jgi:hypothetical protein
MNKFTPALTLLFATILFCLNPNKALAEVVHCEDESCFAKQASACKANTSYLTPIIAGAQVRYDIVGRLKDSCDIFMTYTQHPNPDWTDKPLMFSINPDGDIDAQIKAAVASCLEEGKGGKWLCDGPFYDAAGEPEKPPAPVIASDSPCGVDFAEESPPLYPMPRDGQWGYVTRDGEWAIEPRWAYAEPFSEGRAAVESNGRWGVIDAEGNYVLEPMLQSALSPLQPYSQGCSTANVQKDGSPSAFFVDRMGRFWLEDKLPDALNGKNIWEFGRFSGGRAWFRAMGDKLSESYGWIDAQGNVALKDDFSGAGEFVNGRAPAAQGDRYSWAYIDTQGNPVIPDRWKFKGARPFSEGLAAAAVESHRWMYFDAEGVLTIKKVALRSTREVLGKPVNEAEIQAAGDFHDGLAPIRPAMMFDAGGLIFIHPDGTEAFSPKTDLGFLVCSDLPEFRSGLVQLLVADEGVECKDVRNSPASGRGDKAHYVYLDTSGNIVLQESN